MTKGGKNLSSITKTTKLNNIKYIYRFVQSSYSDSIYRILMDHDSIPIIHTCIFYCKDMSDLTRHLTVCP